jgi:hypothetical protein
MQFFYDGQIRRYIIQTIRVFSNFAVKYGDGTLVQVPVMYGDADRQVASIIRNNSENKVNSVPRISVYITGLSMDKDRLADQTFVDKVQIRERDIDSGTYTTGQGKNYMVERLMPTPFQLKMKVDIWSSSNEQKLQILEQILVLFNPTLELQTSDNYLDWTSLTVLNLSNITWSSKQVPVGNDTPIDIATLEVETPIWINPPVKVKHLGVITKIITSIYGANTTSGTYIEGLGMDPIAGTTTMSDLVSTDVTTITNYKIEVYGGKAFLLGPGGTTNPREPTLNIAPDRVTTPIDWNVVFDAYPGKYIAGSSQIYLTQANGAIIIGTIALDSFDPTILRVNWNPDTLVTNTGIDSTGKLDSDYGYNASTSSRPNSPGTFDAIVDPATYNPKRPTGAEQTDQPVAVGTRLLIIEDIGNTTNTAGTGAKAWQSTGGADFVAHANDIIEWSGTTWRIIFKASQHSSSMVWQTNIYTGVQYLWNGVSWNKSFEGFYDVGQWRIDL